jgi:hypothetical protein
VIPCGEHSSLQSSTHSPSSQVLPAPHASSSSSQLPHASCVQTEFAPGLQALSQSGLHDCDTVLHVWSDGQSESESQSAAHHRTSGKSFQLGHLYPGRQSDESAQGAH